MCRVLRRGVQVTHAALMKAAAAQAVSLESSLDSDENVNDLDARMSLAHAHPAGEVGVVGWRWQHACAACLSDSVAASLPWGARGLRVCLTADARVGWGCQPA